MKLKKERIKLHNVIIEFIFCPGHSLYLQSQFCLKCDNFGSEDDQYLFCNYVILGSTTQESDREKVKERLITEFSQSQQMSEKVLLIKEFSEKLKEFAKYNIPSYNKDGLFSKLSPEDKMKAIYKELSEVLEKRNLDKT